LNDANSSRPTAPCKPVQPTQKTLVIVRGKGTAHETRIPTTIPLYWCARLGAYVTVPQE